MFTVKVYRSHGSQEFHGCEKFSIDAESPVEIALFTRGVGWETVRFERTDAVFVENLMGKTVVAIRPPRQD